MVFNFNGVARLKAIVKKIDKELESPIQDLKECQKEPVLVTTPLFSIYKRSLPINFNSPILMNLTEDDANKAMVRLKTRQYRDADGTSHCIYYEKVQVGTVGVDDLFFNQKTLMREEPELSILRGHDAIAYDYNLGEIRYHD